MIYEVRRRKSRTTTTIRGHHGDRITESVFSEIDNLDTKDYAAAESPYERVFISIRSLLENKSWCCDDEVDRLDMCQSISDLLRKNRLININ